MTTTTMTRCTTNVFPTRNIIRRHGMGSNGTALFQRQSRHLLPLSLLVVLVIVSMLHFHQITLIFLPNECTTCLMRWSTQQQQQQPLLRQRSIVTYDEFFSRGPSLADIEQFFHFDVELYTNLFYGKNSAVNFQFHPLWQRTTTSKYVANDDADLTIESQIEFQNPRKKLIFIHTSRTAGSTIRAILRAYSVRQNKTLLSINRCMDVNYEFMESTDTWRNGRYANPRTNSAYMNCMGTLYSHNSIGDSRSNVLSTSTTMLNNSSSQDSAERSVDSNPADRISSTYLNENSIDILSGQIPLGSDESWFHPVHVNSNGTNTLPHLKHVKARYVIFFRHPMDQFVSEFVSRTMKEGDDDTRSVFDIVCQIKRVVTEANQKQSYYEPLSSHAFITPKQMGWVERQSNILWTPERRINVTRMNLLHNTNEIVIGLVERMSESLSMLQYLIDPDDESTSLIIQYFTSQSPTVAIRQSSWNRTRSIVNNICNDIILRSLVEDYIKYEVQIYTTAVQMHDRQYRWFQQQVVVQITTGNDS